MKITNFGRTEHRALSAAMQAAIAKVADDFGVTIKADGGTIGTSKGVIKLDVSLTDVGGTGISGNQAEWNRYANMLGLKQEWFGLEFYHTGKAYRAVGVLPSRPKNCVSIVEVHSGRSLLCTAHPLRLRRRSRRLPRKILRSRNTTSATVHTAGFNICGRY